MEQKELTQESVQNQIDTSDVIMHIIDDIKRDLTDEEIIALLLNRKADLKGDTKHDRLTFGQKAADGVATFAGSWTFIGLFLSILTIWIIINLLLSTKAFDPYPFILLNLLLSMIAAIQAPMIMMSQNRQAQKDRERANDDYRVNLKTEIIIEDLHQKMIQLESLQDELLNMQKSLITNKE